MCLGIPGRVVKMDAEATMPMGVVDFGGVRREACLVYVADEISLGDYVIVHAGFAISRLDEEEAQRTLVLLRELGEMAETDQAKEEENCNDEALHRQRS